MASKNLHDEPFDESTITKLRIFENYAQEWIPTFVEQGISTICIFDFFAGTGFDKNGVPGSPIRILQKIKEHVDDSSRKKSKIILYLNEFDRKKFELLKEACAKYLQENDYAGRAVEIKFFNENFKELFPKLLPMIRNFPSLIYFDQNGIKFLSKEYLLELERMKQADFLYFVSSSYFVRFGAIKEFQQYFNIDILEAKQNPYKFIHRVIIEQWKKMLSSNSKLKLLPFSLKKGANIYGIIFGATHPRAVEKFLSVVWKINPINGEANFDIDDDELKRQGVLFGNPPLTKIEAFQKRVRDKVLSGEITNNFQLLSYAFDEGHLGSHAAKILMQMKKNGELTYDGTYPLVTYEKVYGRKKRKLEYRIIKK